MNDVFKKFIDGEWPEQIAHLKGRILVRKKDGNRYRIIRHSGQAFGGKPAAYLEPVGWMCDTRSHWKTHEKIIADMEVAS